MPLLAYIGIDFLPSLPVKIIYQKKFLLILSHLKYFNAALNFTATKIVNIQISKIWTWTIA